MFPLLDRFRFVGQLHFVHVVELVVFVGNDGHFVLLFLVGRRSADVVHELTRRLIVHLAQVVLADGHEGHAPDATHHHKDTCPKMIQI